MGGWITLFQDYTFQIVALGASVLGVLSGVVGSFAVLRRQSLLGDGVSHAALPGIAAAFLLTGSKNTEVLLAGALVCACTAVFFIGAVVKYSRVKFDSALATVMSVFFGIGMVLLTYAQKIPDANQAGLKRFLFGQASTLLERDVILMLACGAVLLALSVLFRKEIRLFLFDREFAECAGFSSRWMNGLLSILTVVTIMLGLQTAGVILMSALLIAPAAAARQWTNHFGKMLVLSAAFGGISGFAGTAVSSAVPLVPTGPAIVTAVSLIAGISLLFAPKRGILARLSARRRTAKKLEKGRAFHVSSN